MTPFPSPQKLKIAVITGGHPYDLPAFTDLFRKFPDIEGYPYYLEQWIAETEAARRSFAVVVHYHFHLPEPPSEAAQKVFQDSTETGQGIVVLHHALLGYTDWPFWSELVGIRDRKFYPPSPKNQRLPVKNLQPGHPITRAVADFEMVDEIYLMDDTLAKKGNVLLLETDHPDPKAQRAIAWVRQVEKSRVFCFQSGHDAIAYANPGFIEILGRGIRWASGGEKPDLSIPATSLNLKTRKEKVVLHEEPVPACGAFQILCKTLYTGVSSGTERTLLMGTLFGAPDDDEIRNKAGYQHVARIVEVGRCVTGYEIGDLVFSGRHQGHNAYFVESVDSDNPLFVKLPEGIDLIHAALFGMASIAIHDVRRADIRLGDRVLIVGAGPIGQLVCQSARAAGASTVICDLDAARLELARRTGAEEIVSTRDDAGWQRLHQSGPFDIIFETSGAPIIDKLIGKSGGDPKLIRRRGKISLVALRSEINYVHLAGHAIEAEIQHISHFKLDDLKNVCRLARCGILQMGPLIQEVLPISAAPELYDRLRNDPASIFATVFDWTDGAAKDNRISR